MAQMPGILKNAIDWASGECVMPLPELLVGGASAAFDHDGNLTDPEVRRSIVEFLDALRAWTLRIRVERAAA